MEKSKASPMVVVVPSPGMGHLIPFVEFAKRLVHLHDLTVSVVIPNNGSSTETQKQFVRFLPASISSVFLPPVSFADLPDDTRVEVRIAQTMARSMPALRDTLKALAESTELVALVVDPYAGMGGVELASEFGLRPCVLFSGNAMSMSLMVHLPQLDQEISGEFRDRSEPVKLPGCVPIQGTDLVDFMLDRNGPAYKTFLNLSKAYRFAAGIIVNSFTDLEQGALNSMKEGGAHGVPVHSVGPLLQIGSANKDDGTRHYCLEWLDQKPSRSVLFICFGSGGTLSRDQLIELAAGLEMSRHSFLWVVKKPNDEVKDGCYFEVEGNDDPLSFLPEGFLDRTKETGLVVSSWAPQSQVLSHGSTGGFVTHCGWSSILESFWNGVPVLMWPLYAEQRMNAVFLEEDLKVASRLRVNEKGLVGREEIAKYIKELMKVNPLVGERMSKLKEATEKALSPHGSSTKSLAGLVQTWINKGNKND